MGMYDNVNYTMDCPKCGAVVSGFQSKQDECTLGTGELKEAILKLECDDFCYYDYKQDPSSCEGCYWPERVDMIMDIVGKCFKLRWEMPVGPQSTKQSKGKAIDLDAGIAQHGRADVL